LSSKTVFKIDKKCQHIGILKDHVTLKTGVMPVKNSTLKSQE